jgi:hypothetical protein
MQINLLLKKHVDEAYTRGRHGQCPTISYLNRPNHLIIKPVFAVMVLIRTFPSTPSDMNWHDYDSLHKIWAKVKNQLRKKDFLQKMQAFDIRTVKQSQLDQIRKIYKDDPFMIAERVNRHYGIERESIFALLMFRWANHVI